MKGMQKSFYSSHCEMGKKECEKIERERDRDTHSESKLEQSDLSNSLIILWTEKLYPIGYFYFTFAIVLFFQFFHFDIFVVRR